MGDQDNPFSSDTLVEDSTSSSVWYDGEWSYVTGNQYHGGSQRASSQNGASVHFAFIGEAFWYFATTGPDHGFCSISVDGVVFLPQLSTQSVANQPAGPLYSQRVEPGSHTVTITNLDGRTTTIDYFMYRPVQSVQPTPQDTGLNKTSISFMPANAWYALNDGSTESTHQNAWFSFKIEAEYIWFSWDRNYDHGVYTVSIDGGTLTRFSAYTQNHTDSTVLYSHALSPGIHTLTFTNVEADRRLGVASIIYRQVSQGDSTTTSLSLPSNTSSLSSSLASTTSSSVISTTSFLTPSTLSAVTLTASATSDLSSLEPHFSHPLDSSQDLPSASIPPSSSVSPGAIAGAAAGIASVFIIIPIIIVSVLRNKRRKRRREATRDKLETQRADIDWPRASVITDTVSQHLPYVYPLAYTTENPRSRSTVCLLPEHPETEDRSLKLRLFKE